MNDVGYTASLFTCTAQLAKHATWCALTLDRKLLACKLQKHLACRHYFEWQSLDSQRRGHARDLMSLGPCHCTAWERLRISFILQLMH